MPKRVCYYWGHDISHSIYSTDMLLVLFNAAISNLVRPWDIPALDLVISSLSYRSYFATTSLCLGISPTHSRYIPSEINWPSLTCNQSFQSSTKVLDPATNPSLFQSTLAIIIKVYLCISFTQLQLTNSTRMLLTPTQGR